MNKVVGIEGGKKPDEPFCQFCGAEPACKGMSCPRVALLELYEDGTIAAVEFFDPEVWKPRA